MTTTDDVTELGDAAQEALADIAEGAQDVFDDTDYTKVRFVGMSFDSLDGEFTIGEEMEFRVKARCIGLAKEARKSDGQIRNIAKFDVQSITELEG